MFVREIFEGGWRYGCSDLAGGGGGGGRGEGEGVWRGPLGVEVHMTQFLAELL